MLSSDIPHFNHFTHFLMKEFYKPCWGFLLTDERWKNWCTVGSGRNFLSWVFVHYLLRKFETFYALCLWHKHVTCDVFSFFGQGKEYILVLNSDNVGHIVDPSILIMCFQLFSFPDIQFSLIIYDIVIHLLYINQSGLLIIELL